jgi:hypothetical protein
VTVNNPLLGGWGCLGRSLGSGHAVTAGEELFVAKGRLADTSFGASSRRIPGSVSPVALIGAPVVAQTISLMPGTPA